MSRPHLPLIAGLLASSLLTAADPRPISPAIAIEWLRYGNERFVEGKPVHWHQSIDRRKQVATSDAPRAIILTCSDSTVPPEIIFDQGLGDLFVIRVPANIAGEREQAAIEYASAAFRIPLVVVLGHQRCGFLDAALGPARLPPSSASLLSPLAAVVARLAGMPGDAAANAVHANVDHQRRLLYQSPALARLIAEGRLTLAAAAYNLDSGAVEWLSEPLPAAAITTPLTSQKH
jgi:carbonic anhydrase